MNVVNFNIFINNHLFRTLGAQYLDQIHHRMSMMIVLTATAMKRLKLIKGEHGVEEEEEQEEEQEEGDVTAPGGQEGEDQEEEEVSSKQPDQIGQR